MEIVLSGDFCPHHQVEALFRAKRYADVYRSTLDVLRGADLAVTNLECPLVSRPAPISKTGVILSAHPECAEGIRAGFAAVCLANNHILDHGEEGLASTLSACQSADLKTVGAGLTASDAALPLYLDVKGTAIAIINVAENEFSTTHGRSPGANPMDPIAVYRQIRSAKQRAAVVIVVAHGGNEFFHLPSPRIVDTYRFFADSGASAVVAHHPHVAGGYELHHGVPIFYSLGNFLFESRIDRNERWQEGYLVRLSFDGSAFSGFHLEPYVQHRDGPYVELMPPEGRARFLDRIGGYSRIIGEPAALEAEWAEFCAAKQQYYSSELLSAGRLERTWRRLGLQRKAGRARDRLLTVLNLVRCEAHRDVAIRALEAEVKR